MGYPVIANELAAHNTRPLRSPTGFLGQPVVMLVGQDVPDREEQQDWLLDDLERGQCGQSDGTIRRRYSGEFPWATVIINVIGSLLLGFLMGMVVFHSAPTEVQLIIGVGF